MRFVPQTIESMQARYEKALKPAVIAGNKVIAPKEPPAEHVFDFADGWRLLISVEPVPAGVPAVAITGAIAVRPHTHTDDDLLIVADHFAKVSQRQVLMSDALHTYVEPRLVSLSFPR